MNARIPDEYNEFMDSQANAAFNFTARIANPTWAPGPTTIGSTIGVPPANAIAGMTPGSGTGAGASVYATSVLQRGPGSHPVFWAIVIFMVGIILLGFVAHLEVKGRR